MRNLIIFILALFLVACGATPKEKKVLIIGLDGCRPDVLESANTANIKQLMENGAYCLQAKTDPISSSGICWTGMLTGVWHEKHNVINNNYENPNIAEYPHFFRRVKEFNPELRTASVVNWQPIHKIFQEGDADIAENYSPDEKVAERVSEILSSDQADVVFVQLDDVDHAGHTYDYSVDSQEYVRSVEKADSLTGIMVDALKKRPNYLNEDWLILVSTDHGGSNFGHGKDIPDHTTIFYVANGESVKKGKLEDGANVIDVAVTAMQHLGITINETWKLDGKPRGIQ